MQVFNQIQQNCQSSHSIRRLLHSLASQKSSWLQSYTRKHCFIQFKGDKQHDANDFFLNFLNLLNDHLKKAEDKAYHKIL